MSARETISAKSVVDYWQEQGVQPLAAPAASGAPKRNSTLNEADRLQSSGQFEQAAIKYREYAAELKAAGKEHPLEYVAIRLHLNQALFFASQTHKLAYRPTPKCACSTIKTAFFEVLYSKRYSPEDTNTGHVHQYFTRNVKRVEIDPNEYFAFAVARDPIKRFVSGYRNRVMHHGDIGKLLDIDGQKYDPPALSDFALALPHFLNMALPISHHMSPQKAVLGDNLNKYSKIYKIEELSDLQAELSRRAGTAIPFGREQTGGPKISLTDLSSDAFEYLLDFFEQDYELFTGLYSREDIKSEYYGRDK
jgi:hypothetical protein